MDTAALLKSIKRRARLHLVSLPAGATTDFMEIMNEVFANEVLPHIIAMREEFYVATTTWDTSAGREFTIPSDAIGQKLRGLYLLDSTGKRTRPIPLRNRDAANGFMANTGFNRFGYMPGIELQDDTLIADESATYSVEVAYYRMPNTMVYFAQATPQATATDKVYRVATVSGANLTLTNPTTLTSTGTPVSYDIISPAYPYKKKGTAVITFTAPFSANPQTATFTGDTPAVDDWLFLEGYTGFANIPREAELYFILCCASAILNFMGAAEFAQVDELKSKQLQTMQNLIDPRDDASPWTVPDSRGAFDFL